MAQATKKKKKELQRFIFGKRQMVVGAGMSPDENGTRRGVLWMRQGHYPNKELGDKINDLGQYPDQTMEFYHIESLDVLIGKLQALREEMKKQEESNA